jgi:hypothetical protein
MRDMAIYLWAMDERPRATSEWLKPLDQRVASYEGPRPLAITLAAVTSALLTPLMAYLAISFMRDVFDFASRPGYPMWVQILGYTFVAAGMAALAIACPVGARRVFKYGDPTYTDRIGLVIGVSMAFVLGLSIASNGRIDSGLFAALGPAMIGGFGLSWLVRRQRSRAWLQTRRRQVREGSVT